MIEIKEIKAVWRDWCGPEQNWLMRRGARSFYAWKAIITLLIGRYKEYDHYERDSVEVAVLWYKTGTNWEYWDSATWETLVVPRGVRGWFYDTRYDSTP